MHMQFDLLGTSVRVIGTLHAVPQGGVGWEAAVRQAVTWSERIVLEMTPESGKSLMISPAYASTSTLNPGLLEQLKSIWLAGVSPMAECNLITAWLVACFNGINSERGVEGLIGEMLDETPRPVIGLESAEDFLAAFDDVSAAEVEKAICMPLSDASRNAAMFRAFYNAWRNADRVTLAKLTGAQLPKLGRMQQALYDRRNKAWAPKISEFTKQSAKTLIAVGAGHLCGKNNLLEVLERGYGLKSKRSPA
jgi:uncharacterized protein YbaP (TraB family)